MTTLIISILKKYWYWAALIGSAITIYLLSSDIKAKKAEISRKTSNIETLNTDFTSYVTDTKVVIAGKDTIIKRNAAKVSSLTYTLDEFKRYKPEAEQTINDMGLKLKNVVSVANIGTQTTQQIITPTIKTDSTTCFSYIDSFISVAGCSDGKKTTLYYASKDSLTTVVNTIPKHKFLWWSWGVKAINLNILSKNPNTTFTYLNYIELKK